MTDTTDGSLEIVENCQFEGAAVPGSSRVNTYDPPERKDYDGISSPSELAEQYQSDYLLYVFTYQPHNSLEPAPWEYEGNPHLLWGEPGEPVTIRATWVTNGSERTVELTPLKNYRAVAANITLYNRDRSKVIETHHSKGLQLKDRQYLAADITIPASAFEAGKVYDLSLATLVKRPGLEGTPSTETARFTLLYGGFERSNIPSSDCPISRDASSLTQTEFGLWEKILWTSDGFLYPTGATDIEEFRDPIPAEPGETVSVEMLVQETLRQELDRLPIMAVPMLDGKPIGEPMFYLEGSTPGKVGYRDDFEVTLPDEPGYHYVEVVLFLHAFQVAETLEAEPIRKYMAQGIQRSSLLSGLVYHVEDR